MKTFIWRLFRKNMVVQIALTVLLASAVCLFAIYNAHLAGESRNMGQRIARNNDMHGFYLVTDREHRPNPDQANSYQWNVCNLVIGWHLESTPSNLGDLPVTYIDATKGSMFLEKNVAAIHAAVATRLGVKVGDTITLDPQGEALAVEVVDIYSTTTPFNSGIDFGESVLVHTGQPGNNNEFLYQLRAWSRENQVRNTLASIHSRRSHIRPLNEDDPMAAMIVKSNYSVMTQARATLLLFLTLAFLTAKLLSYMDTRRVLAIFKALGLYNRQVSGTILSEALISPVLGAITGGILATVVLHALNSAGHNLPVNATIISVSMLSVFPAVFIGAWAPARLAKVATVNELLFERPTPLFRTTVDSVGQRFPGLEAMTSQGVRLLKLSTVEGHFEGFIFRRLGDTLQAGEVIAVEQSWWGLKSVEYVSPVTGTIVYFEDQTGMVGIEPDNK